MIVYPSVEGVETQRFRSTIVQQSTWEIWILCISTSSYNV